MRNWREDSETDPVPRKENSLKIVTLEGREVENEKEIHAWKARFNAVRKNVKCPKCPDHLKLRDPQLPHH